MKLAKIILAAALGLSAASAFADWQPYVGLGVGFLDGGFATQVSTPPLYNKYYPGTNLKDSNSGAYNFSINSGQLSPTFQVGISNQYNKIYVGFEASLWYNNNTYTSNTINDNVYTSGGVFLNSADNQVISNLHYNGSLTTQLGYFITPNFMPYVKLGVAAAKAGVTYNFNDIPDSSSSASGTLFYTFAHPWMFGPTASLGGQYSFTQNLRGFAEVNYVKMWGSATPSGNITAYGSGFPINGPVTPFKQNYTFTSWTAEIGTNYYF